LIKRLFHIARDVTVEAGVEGSRLGTFHIRFLSSLAEMTGAWSRPGSRPGTVTLAAGHWNLNSESEPEYF